MRLSGLLKKPDSPTQIDRWVIEQIFNQPQWVKPVTFYNRPPEQPGGQAPAYPAFFIRGNIEVNLDGNSQKFRHGALVYQKSDGTIQAAEAQLDRMNNERIFCEGMQSIATQPNGDATNGLTTLTSYDDTFSLTTHPKSAGFKIPAAGFLAKDLVDQAEEKGAITLLRDSDGKLIEGFFVEKNAHCSILPASLHNQCRGIRLTGGEFLSISRDPETGELHALYPYRKNPEQKTGMHGDPLSGLTTMEGEAVNPKTFPYLELLGGQAVFPKNYTPLNLDRDALRDRYIEAKITQKRLSFAGNPYLHKPHELPDLKEWETEEATQREKAASAFDRKTAAGVGLRQLLMETDEQEYINHSGFARLIHHTVQAEKSLARARNEPFNEAAETSRLQESLSSRDIAALRAQCLESFALYQEDKLLNRLADTALLKGEPFDAKAAIDAIDARIAGQNTDQKNQTLASLLDEKGSLYEQAATEAFPGILERTKEALKGVAVDLGIETSIADAITVEEAEAYKASFTLTSSQNSEGRHKLLAAFQERFRNAAQTVGEAKSTEPARYACDSTAGLYRIIDQMTSELAQHRGSGNHIAHMETNISGGRRSR